MKKGYLTLKWGTIKSFDFTENEKAAALWDEYIKEGASLSAMMQKDSPRQKELICQMIDAVPGKIYLEWDDKEVTKKEAKKYVLEY